MPFLTTQKSWAGSRLWAISFRSGGSGFKPSMPFASHASPARRLEFVAVAIFKWSDLTRSE
jgi:hypothetical protein